MSACWYWLCFIGIFLFSTFSPVGCILTAKQYEEWKCGRICEDKTLKELVGQTCYKLMLQNPVDKAYSKDEVVKNSGCINHIPVQFQDGQEVVKFWRHVGICRLSDDTTRCITMGKETDEVLVYSFSGEGCRLLEKGQSYEMKIEEMAPVPPAGRLYNVVVSFWNAWSPFPV